ncbi:MAG: uroporphyrinogen-III C-methyltransferase [Hungatella sp.]
MDGKVYLVGGGPGDLELLTRKAYRLICEADCLIYDRLIDPKILEETKPTCEHIYVGKENRNHSMRQEEINQLLVDKASVYPLVVRLKGGDVYVFGRGGEEALFLREHQVPFEVVPGITSAIAGLAYAGIPITHRGIAGGFHVVTAHNKLDELAEIDFCAMAKSEDTAVFLMGLTKLPEIVSHLMEAGKSGDTQIAVISHATLPTQEVLTSTLSRVVEDFRRQPLSSPALIVIGGVVGLREKLNFFEEKRLFGTRILLPRVGNQASVLAEQLTRLGANVCEVQTGFLKENQDALDSLDYRNYTHIVLTSKNAVQYFMNSLHKNKVDLRMLHGIRFAVIGSATRAYLEEFGIYADLMPETYHRDALWKLLEEHLKPTDHVLFPKGKALNEEGQELEDKLREICPTDVVILYENEPMEQAEPTEYSDLKNHSALTETQFDLAVFTCSSCVRRSVEAIKESQNRTQIKYISIGEKTSETLRKHGIHSVIQAKQATFESLLDTILEQADNQ